MAKRSGEKIYGFTLAGALAAFVGANKGTAEYLLEQAFRYLKSAHGMDTLVTGAGNFNRELNYLALDGISDYKKGMKDMSDQQQDERQRDPLEDHITITADARGPLTVQILFTRAELRYLLIMLMASHDACSYDQDQELERSIRIKVEKLLAGGAR